jgi:hypothetical protein
VEGTKQITNKIINDTLTNMFLNGKYDDLVFFVTNLVFKVYHEKKFKGNQKLDQIVNDFPGMARSDGVLLPIYEDHYGLVTSLESSEGLTCCLQIVPPVALPIQLVQKYGLNVSQNPLTNKSLEDLLFNEHPKSMVNQICFLSKRNTTQGDYYNCNCIPMVDSSDKIRAIITDVKDHLIQQKLLKSCFPVESRGDHFENQLKTYEVYSQGTSVFLSSIKSKPIEVKVENGQIEVLLNEKKNENATKFLLECGKIPVLVKYMK